MSLYGDSTSSLHSSAMGFNNSLPLFLTFRADIDGYYVAYKLITLVCILFIFIEMDFFHCHSCVMFVMKSMSICND